MIEIIARTDYQRRREILTRTRARSVALDADLMRFVTGIIEDVRTRGDRALIELTRRFDNVELEASQLRVNEQTLRESAARVAPDVIEALREAIMRIKRFHEHERQASWNIEPVAGVRLGQRFSPISAAGLYVPGGTASYPSSVVMNVVPAQVAGVPRLAVVTPPQMLHDSPAVAAALLELNVTEIYQVGGAHAVAALAYGTETIARVDKITGPGNKYVAAAKKLVFGAVGIDSIAGPSEVIIIADDTANPRFVAADLLAQAEHDREASAILITTDTELARQVKIEVERQTKELPRRSIIEDSLKSYGAIIIVETLREACDMTNELAPEHLEIITRDAEEISGNIEHAGAIFLGAYTPEAVGDYFAGPNHVLPTGGAARFSSALGVNDFMRHTSILRYSENELRHTAPMIAALAKSESLDAHARSVLIRIDSLNHSVIDSMNR
ncbi:MAG: histidinol dehydrogenase [Pyrinomonadaceae bacterium MAG19_C2-C3]|nr:histidinol dehydrogenase [Pyrinomonadaceae bacterium MAG19_C2-C3]